MGKKNCKDICKRAVEPKRAVCDVLDVPIHANKVQNVCLPNDIVDSTNYLDKIP